MYLPLLNVDDNVDERILVILIYNGQEVVLFYACTIVSKRGALGLVII